MNKCRKLKIGLVFDYDHDYGDVSVVVTKTKPTGRAIQDRVMLVDDDLARGGHKGAFSF